MQKQVLLAEGDDAVRRMIARVLEAQGYTPLLASNGAEAAEFLRNNKADLVLAELKEPDGEGWEALRRVRGAAPSIPFIVITAWSNQHDRAAREGIDALMEKPLDLPELLLQIADLLSKSDSERLERLNRLGASERKTSLLGEAA